ncbi:elongin C [Coniosporium tulheliwenetii]|uniref:Elongin C n=1 Tax=Coniosporium tulheliwenetii TaxID=3383036 RepID=A0ACC2ZKY3_9PEZI|nr:elongin C [Cladosporium sp. JES 115]
MAQQQTDYVTLVSSDGFEFKLQRSAATISGAIKRMLDPISNFTEAQTNTCTFENIKYDSLHPLSHHAAFMESSVDSPRSGVVLEKVCEYLYYNEKHKNNKDVPDMDIPPELCLELLMAADFLDGEFAVGYLGFGC